MRCLCLHLVFLLHLCRVAYGGKQGPPSANEPEVPRTYMSVLFDPGLTMVGGAETSITVQRGLAWAEDRFLGTRWFSERGWARKVGGVAVRFAKLTYLDLPVDYFSVVFAHEYFGHGARYRELNIGNIDYGFDLPPPYGAGGGQAVAYINSPISDHELLAIWSAGLEVQPIINRRLSLLWVAKREINYREAFLYFWSWQIGFRYVQSTSEDLTGIDSDNDPQAYIRIINRHAGYDDAHHLRMGVGDLKARSKIDLANPFLFYSVFAVLKTYLWDGHTSTSLPMLKIAGIGYLPSFRMQLTPFGPEYHIENYLQVKDIVSLVDLRIGDPKFHNNWGGAGVLIQNLHARRRFSLDMNVHIWKQPELELTENVITSNGGGLGGAFSVRGYFDLSDADRPVSAVVELGYKSTGFLQGYALDSSPIVFLGLALRN